MLTKTLFNQMSGSLRALHFFFVCLTLSLPFAALSAEHPRLMFGAAEVLTLRQKIKTEPIASMFARLKEDAETDNWAGGPLVADSAYDQSCSAHRCAFLYVLTGDDAWAKKSRIYVEQRLADSNWANANTKGLSLYFIGKSVALAYDWCYGAPSWDTAFSKLVSSKLLAQANVIFEKGGKEQNANPASNWQALRWSTGGLIYLAIDDSYDTKRVDDCYGRVARYLTENLGGDPKSRGWNCEGLGYTFFPMANGVAPFAVAMQRKDSAKDLRKSCAGAAYTLWTCYAPLIKTSTGLWRPDFSDDNPGATGEGSYGFAFYFCPPELQPGLKYWYDRTVGTQGDKTFDRARFGTATSILFYPEALAEQDPMSIPQWREAMIDTGGNGMQTWRNQYRDADDLVAQLYVKLRGNRGHNGPDALSFRIVGLDTLWAVGGGRYGPKLNGQDAYWRSMNTVYPVDPDSTLKTNDQSGKIVGKPIVLPDGGGSIVSHIAQNNVGATNHKRWFIADYSRLSGTEGVYVIYDTSDDGKFWQLCTLETQAISTRGNSFTIAGENGCVLEGTVLYPASPVTMKTGTRLRGSNAGTVKNNNFVHTQSPDGCHLVVLTLRKKGQSQPTVTATGTWGKAPKGTITVGKLSITIDGDTISYPAGK